MSEKRIAEKGTVRYYRQKLAAIDQALSDLHAPIREGIRNPPLAVGEGLRDLMARCRELDREWAKSDKRRPAVGGELRVVFEVEDRADELKRVYGDIRA